MSEPARSKGRRFCRQSQVVFKPMWSCIGMVGMRRCSRLLQKTAKGYGDTIFHFDPPKPMIALTIDDGLCRGKPDASMADDVFALLQKYNATATFFVCTDYVKDHEESVQLLLKNGHELGNHLESDRLWYYPKLTPEEFRDELQKANRILDDLEERCGASATENKTRWFRAPQGLMNEGMERVIATAEGNTKHVLGDCYCDDWCFAQEADPLFDEKEEGNPRSKKRREKAMKQVAKLMLAQVKIGSVAILHMPEKGFRQGNLLALEYFLQGLQRKKLTCVNLSEMQAACGETEQSEETGECNGSDDTLNEGEEDNLKLASI